MEKPLFGMYRAKVVENRDPQKFGRVIVWIPDFMPEVDQNTGIWARPANNPIGGRNQEGNTDHHFMGTSFIPRKGAWVWIFFEAGNINRPYYIAALDLENTKVLPENQLGSNYQDKWVIFKSHEGRCIVISDDPDDARVEITGKKRQMNNPPTGDTASVYNIDNNQTTILFDERDGKQKILIRTHKGDFLNIDVEDRKLQAFFEDEIHIKSGKSIFISANENIHIRSKLEDIFISADSGNIHESAAQEIKKYSGGDFHMKTAGDQNLQADGDTSILSGGNSNRDATFVKDQQGASKPAEQATKATEANPVGDRNS